MGSNVMTREDDERALEILDLWDSGDMRGADLRERFGMSNGSIQGLVLRCLKTPDREHRCACQKPENKNGGMPRGWWR